MQILFGDDRSNDVFNAYCVGGIPPTQSLYWSACDFSPPSVTTSALNIVSNVDRLERIDLFDVSSKVSFLGKFSTHGGYAYDLIKDYECRVVAPCLFVSLLEEFYSDFSVVVHLGRDIQASDLIGKHRVDMIRDFVQTVYPKIRVELPPV